MEKAKFENLQIYQLAEKLADEIWYIVMDWEFFAKDTIGKQIWLRRAYTRKLLTHEQVQKLEPIVGELSAKLNAYLKYLTQASQNKYSNCN